MDWTIRILGTEGKPTTEYRNFESLSNGCTVLLKKSPW